MTLVVLSLYRKNIPCLDAYNSRCVPIMASMASLVSKFHTYSIRKSKQITLARTFFQTISFPNQQQQNYSVSISQFSPTCLHKTKFSSSIYCCSLSSSSLPSPPTTKEEAIFQAKTCLSSALEKPLNNPKLPSKLKKVKQPRFRVEIPVMDDSPESLSRLAFDIFQDISIKKKGSQVKTVILWPDTAFIEAGISAFKASSLSQTRHVNLSSLSDGDIRTLNSADVAVFFAPDGSKLDVMESVTESLNPKPVVIFNPRWAYDEESEFGELSSFVGSFDVIYSFTGLEVRGILSKRKGVIFKCVRDGVLSGERWNVLVEEEDGALKVVSMFKGRPSIGEVETVLYNLMAMNSPITKSAKFFSELVSNVTGKKRV